MTSAIIQSGISFIREKKSQGIDIKIPRKSTQIDENFSVKEIFDKKNAVVIENNGKLTTKKIDLTEEKSGFSYFLDGIEKKKILFYYRSIPVIYGYVAAVILKRTDKKMHSIDMEMTEENFYLPKKDGADSPEHYFSEEEVKNLGKNIVNIGKIPVNSANKDYPLLPEQFIQAAHNSIQGSRGHIEKALAKRWLSGNSQGSWLFIDGRLENKNKELISGSNIVGIIKSHHACYFDYEDQYKIYSMEKGERSSVFQPEGENIYSWYLRLHSDKRHGDNNFGLIRVEIPAEEEFLRKADLISSWILLETKPVAFPASRWDRMIYPIKYCEDYLKSKAPSWKVIDSLY
ncbi:MAG TPA: hypothetical protein P5556_04535 [Candidatus Gastranaerophilales bacterium]|nr:hypothetical protein [Candidatus Gastranaerophilales bacterium]